jgi:hypothetical protein
MPLVAQRRVFQDSDQNLQYLRMLPSSFSLAHQPVRHSRQALPLLEYIQIARIKTFTFVPVGTSSSIYVATILGADTTTLVKQKRGTRPPGRPGGSAQRLLEMVLVSSGIAAVFLDGAGKRVVTSSTDCRQMRW